MASEHFGVELGARACIYLVEGIGIGQTIFGNAQGMNSRNRIGIDVPMTQSCMESGQWKIVGNYLKTTFHRIFAAQNIGHW